jgi:hypothetical protein
MGANSNSH